MKTRLINGWHTGKDIYQFTLAEVWYIDKNAFGYVTFGFVLLNFGVVVDMR